MKPNWLSKVRPFRAAKISFWVDDNRAIIGNYYDTRQIIVNVPWLNYFKAILDFGYRDLDFYGAAIKLKFD